MIGNINPNSAKPWSSSNSQATNNPQSATFYVPPNSRSNTLQLDGNALVSGAVRLPGGAFMSASVFKADGFSAANPVFLVRGIDADGSSFEAEINIHNVNPRNATLIEMFALDGYLTAKNGHTSQITRSLAAASIKIEFANANASTQFNFISIMENFLESLSSQGLWESYSWFRPVLGTLKSFAHDKSMK